MKLRLQTKYSLTILSLVTAIVLILGGVLLFYFKASMHDMTKTSSETMASDLLEQLKKRGEILTRFLAQNTTNALYQYDMETIYEIITAAKQQKDVVYV